jgi:hypothetical protein
MPVVVETNQFVVGQSPHELEEGIRDLLFMHEVHIVDTPLHVLQLVAHWMHVPEVATGLYPFVVHV